jgi:hypothetical protein
MTTQVGISKDAAARSFAIDLTRDEPTAGERTTQVGISKDAAARSFATDPTRDGPAAGERTTQVGISKDPAARSFATDTHTTRDEPTAGETATEPGVSKEPAACCVAVDRQMSRDEPTSGERTTQVGISKAAAGFAVDPTRDEPTAGETATRAGVSKEPAACLLRIIGWRGNWTLDELADQSGLGFPELQYALLLLELMVGSAVERAWSIPSDPGRHPCSMRCSISASASAWRPASSIRSQCSSNVHRHRCAPKASSAGARSDRRATRAASLGSKSDRGDATWSAPLEEARLTPALDGDEASVPARRRG